MVPEWAYLSLETVHSYRFSLNHNSLSSKLFHSVLTLGQSSTWELPNNFSSDYRDWIVWRQTVIRGFKLKTPAFQMLHFTTLYQQPSHSRQLHRHPVSAAISRLIWFCQLTDIVHVTNVYIDWYWLKISILNYFLLIRAYDVCCYSP